MKYIYSSFCHSSNSIHIVDNHWYCITCIQKLTLSQKLGVSVTALSAISVCYGSSIFGSKKDKNAEEIHATMPNFYMIGFWFYFFPTYILYRIYAAINETITCIVNGIPASRVIWHI